MPSPTAGTLFDQACQTSLYSWTGCQLWGLLSVTPIAERERDQCIPTASSEQPTLHIKNRSALARQRGYRSTGSSDNSLDTSPWRQTNFSASLLTGAVNIQPFAKIYNYTQEQPHNHMMFLVFLFLKISLLSSLLNVFVMTNFCILTVHC